MTHFEHPPYIGKHEPTHTTHELGTKVACGCGWWSTAESAPKATRAFLAHLAEAKAKEG